MRKLTADRGVDLILDIIGGSYTARNLASLAVDGRLVQIGLMSGETTASIDLRRVLARRLVITGSTLRPRSDDEKARITTEVERVVWPWLESGKLAAVIDRTFPLAETSAAQAYLEAGALVGKVVLEV